MNAFHHSQDCPDGRETAGRQRQIKIAVMLLAVFSFSCSSYAKDEKKLPVVSSVRGLLLAAIDDPAGRSEAWLTGPMAEKLKSETKAPSGTRVRASVSTVTVYREGCKRLRLSIAMPTHKMPTVNGTQEPFQVNYELNLCRDGQPPEVSPVGMDEK